MLPLPRAGNGDGGDPTQRYSPFLTRMSYLEHLSKVDVETLLERNEVYDEPGVHETVDYAVCRLCLRPMRQCRVIRLNNGGRVCEDCFRKLLTTRYPAAYQKPYEEWLKHHAAWNMARDEYFSTHPAAEGIKRATRAARTAATALVVLMVSCGLLLLLAGSRWLAVLLPLVLCTIGAIVCIAAARRKAATLRKKLASDKAAWLAANPAPPNPDLKEFHDPTAELTERDVRTLEVLDSWPGVPPFWSYVRAKVLCRDGNRCQVSGCPSRTELHVHHIKPRSKGGSHSADNLVTLCLFHHGLCPGEGHQLVWREAVTDCFSIVSSHYRDGLQIKAHLRRRTLATQSDLARIVSDYALSCHVCHSAPTVRVDETENKVLAQCLCAKPAYTIDRQLLEETGPRLAGHYDVGRNGGSWDITPFLFNYETPDILPKPPDTQSVSRFPQGNVFIVPDHFFRRNRPTKPSRTSESRRRR